MAGATLFQSLDTNLEVGPHSFQPLLQLLILCLKFLDPGGKFAQLLNIDVSAWAFWVSARRAAF